MRFLATFLLFLFFYRYESKWRKSQLDHPIGLSPEDVEIHRAAKAGNSGVPGLVLIPGETPNTTGKQMKKKERSFVLLTCTRNNSFSETFHLLSFVIECRPFVPSCT